MKKILAILLCMTLLTGCGKTKHTEEYTGTTESETVETTYSDDTYVDNDISSIEPLYSDATFSSLTEEEKLSVMNSYVAMNYQDLGVSYTPYVTIEDLDYNVLGEYYNQHISLSRNLVEECNVEEIMETLSHEAFHAYEHEFCDLYETLSPEKQLLVNYSSQYDIEQWIYEFDNYQGASADYDLYYNQNIEADARSYGEQAVYNYSSDIYNYVNGY